MPKQAVIELGDTGGVTVSTVDATYTGVAALVFLREFTQRLERLLKSEEEISKLQGNRDNALVEIDASLEKPKEQTP